MNRTFLAVAIAALLASAPHSAATESSTVAVEITGSGRSGTLEDGQWAFYNAQYQVAAEMTLEPCSCGAGSLAACELRTAALLFQIRRALGAPADKDRALKQCLACPDLLSAFESALARGQALARARLATHPDDHTSLFLLGKLNLNYVWLQLGTLGRKTGWGEYREARRALNTVLKRHPEYVRARVARAWIDYIVDTKMPRGTRWLLGGGNKKRGLRVVREAAETATDFFAQAEARFALWDMQVRERNILEAVVTARLLVRDFPDNPELNTFLEAHGHSLSPR
jgi:hypothetical protein